MQGISICRNHSGAIVRQVNGWHSEVAFSHSTVAPLVLSQSTDFVEFFAPLFPAIASRYWLLEDVAFAFPSGWDGWHAETHQFEPSTAWDAFLGEHLALNGDFRLVRPRFLESYARYFSDDWCAIAGFATAPESPLRFLETYARHVGMPADKLRKLNTELDILFLCVDGLMWELFARDRRLLAIVQQHLAGRQDLHVEPLTLEQSRG
ncbi:MAG: hypothetical protein AAFX40_05370 [Cyanobacteria bacterium J06639_1]